MKPRNYCCCAIPMVNAGIYATLTEQLVLGILVGALAVGTPSIVGAAAVPSFAAWILAIVSFVAAGIQILGFIGVAKEKTILYRRYVTLHGLSTTAAFAIAAAWAIISATGHNTAKTKCLQKFFTGDLAGSNEADVMCTVFPWVDVGIMGALWVILALLQLYLFFGLSSYGRSQRHDHDQYDQVYDPTRPLKADNIPMNNRNDPWDSRPSTDTLQSPNGNEYKHLRQASASEVMDEPFQHPKDNESYGDYANNYPEQTSYPPYSDTTRSANPTYPSYARTQDPGPTPQYNDTYYSGPSILDTPSQAQPHPNEGSFRRKTPRGIHEQSPINYR